MTERKITMGTDPEFFMRDKKTYNLVSAIPYIKGDKKNPIDLPSGGNIQADNVAVEFATTPAKTTKEFIKNIKNTIFDTIKIIPEKFELAVIPSAEFDLKELEDPKAREFGCEPDYCAWELKVNNPPVPPNEKFRSCGGHIHIGCINDDGSVIHPDVKFLLDDFGKVNMVKGMDLFHGIISTVLDNSEESIRRKELYGKAGCHRPTKYGVEYRTLSNYWTKTPFSSMLMSSLADDVVEVIATGKLNKLIEDVGSEDIQRIINTGNIEDAEMVIEKFLKTYMSEDSKFYFEECITKLHKENNIVKAWEIEI